MDEKKRKRLLAATHAKRESRFLISRRIVLFAIFALILSGVLSLYFMQATVVATLNHYSAQVPENVVVDRSEFTQPIRFFDTNGNLLLEEKSDELRYYVAHDQISPLLLQAIVSIEDHRFYEHHGVDLVATARSLLHNIASENRSQQGGSTLTQQLARNLYLGREKELPRKIRELIISERLEEEYTKDEIIELYLNSISFGGTLYGVETAAQTYFRVPASDVTLPQAAALAALPKAPSQLSPYTNPRGLNDRKNIVLAKMHEYGYVTEDEMLRAQNTALEYHKPVSQSILAPHFTTYVQDVVKSKYTETTVNQGIDVHTTLDIDLQEKAQNTLTQALAEVNKKYKVQNASAVILDAPTGAILAMVGSRDFRDTAFGQYNAVLAQRQPGSTLKPLIYAMSFDTLNYSPNTIIRDEKINIRGYSPFNFDRSFRGNVSLSRALVSSLNVPAVKTLDRLGFANFSSKMNLCDLNLSNDAGLSMAIGGASANLLSITNAYGIFVNNGECIPVNPITRIETRDDMLIYSQDAFERLKNDTSIFSSQATGDITSILKQTKTYFSEIAGTLGADPALKDAALKTGTSDGPRDAWTIGYIDNFVVGVWAGNNDNSPMHPDAIGLTVATPIWHDLTKMVVAEYKPQRDNSI